MATIKGGDKLGKALAEIAKNAANASSVQIGFMEGATYPDGTSVPLVAALNEFGVPAHNQPPRPFFRGMINDKSGEWPEAVAGLLKSTNYDAHKTLDQTGEAIGGQLKEAITVYVGPPLSPVTIAKKGFDKQLVDTSVMLNSITHVVEDKS